MPTLPRPTGRPRRHWRHRPVPYWLLASVVPAVTAALVGRLVTDAAAERDRWGQRRPAVVLAADVASGEPIAPGDVVRRELPTALVPDGAVTTLPSGAVATVDLHAGEVVLASRLAGRGTSATSARLPAGTRGIAVPTSSGLPLEIGDRVDLLATFDPSVTGDGEPTFLVGRAAVVVHVGEDTATVAVDEDDAPQVAYALAAGMVTPILSATRWRR